MPTYCYQTLSGEIVEQIMSCAEMKARQDKEGWITLDDGRAAQRDMGVEMNGRAAVTWSRPIESQALGVGPQQVKEAESKMAEMGCPTRYTKDGAAVIESRSHRNMLMRLNGMRDLDAGYGDYAGA